MGKRNLYLKTIPVEEAKKLYETALSKVWETKYEEIPVIEAFGRVTKHAVYARNSSPLYNASAMDGIAVISSRTAGASETTPNVVHCDKLLLYALVSSDILLYPPSKNSVVTKTLPLSKYTIA